MSTKATHGSDNREGKIYTLQICPSLYSKDSVCYCLPATKDVTAAEVIRELTGKLNLDASKCYVLAEVKESGGEEWILDANDLPVQRVLLWPRRAQEKHSQSEGYYFLLQERNNDGTIRYINLQVVAKEREKHSLVERGFLPPESHLYNDLCKLPTLTEETILQTFKTRFLKHKIYTYAGSILIAINPFKFLPIYNPKYVKMYENHQLGKLEPHIFAVADVAYHTMLKKQVNQCIVISGESGSGKTQSTNFLIHCLTALSQKGYASGVERTILGAGPVLEAFGNAKTAHNNNSSRFGKFIQVNYLENGLVRGAVVEKYLLEKSRLVSQEADERNYHVFYYLLLGASEVERRDFQLQPPQHYHYLNQKENFCIDDGEDLKHDFERLKQAMEMVGFLHVTKNQIFFVLSAILYLGNVVYTKKATGREEGLEVGPPEVLDTLSELLKVKRDMLVEALTKRKTVTVGEKLILPYSLNEAVTTRDSMAKSLYAALFDWIVLRINHALLNKKDMEESVMCLSIGVLDIFGFEDFANNSFEQFCINYANEQLQYYFNQHIFKLEQEEYQSEGITWHNIDYTDNVGCIHLISKKPTGLFHLLDEESNFPHATNQTLLAKLKQQHEDNRYFVGTPVMEPAFIIQHFAGRVKYQIKDFREKNTDYMRPDIVALLRGSDSAFIRELIGMDPVSVFRWATLRAAIRAVAAFNEAARLRAKKNKMGIIRPTPRVPLSEMQWSNTPIEKVYRDLHAQLMNSIRGWAQSLDNPHSLLKPLRRFERPHSYFLKNKGLKQKLVIPKNLIDSSSLKHIMGMTLHDRTTKSLLHLHKKKKPPSISAQFQASLNKLMEALGKAEPFFIRCIRSNAKKMELCFDDDLVLQQLKYTGMLETVRIRRSGYSAKYTLQEFRNQFQVLLPRNAEPLQEAIAALFNRLELDRNNCQIGKTKVFMKESERQKLQDVLHREVMRKILLLQNWFRTILERKRFLRMRRAAITIQAHFRSVLVRLALQRLNAANLIQMVWRGYVQRCAYLKQVRAIKFCQAVCRGYLARKRNKEMLLPQDEGLLPTLPSPTGYVSETLNESQDGDRTPTKLAVQKKTSQELDLNQHLESPKSQFRIPLRRLLGKRQADKKFSKEGTPTLEDIALTLTHEAMKNFGDKPEARKSATLPMAHSTQHPYVDAAKDQAGKVKRSRSIKISNATTVSEQWGAHAGRITNANELKHLDEFLLNKVNDLSSRVSQESNIEALFIRVTEKFRRTLKSMYPVHNGQTHVGYRDLIQNYQMLLAKLVGERQKTEVQFVLNLFQSLLDEFARGYSRKEETETLKPTKSQKKRRKRNQIKEEVCGHMFRSYQVNIGQSCEQCSSYIWPMEKALLCCSCRMTCHKRCLTKIQHPCQSGCNKNDADVVSRHFGVQVIALTDENQTLPMVMEKLLEYVEMHGLYTEGIYRKSGAANKMKDLRQQLEEDPDSVQLENYHIHAITGVLKQWLRELPVPLMTFDLYGDFLRAIEHPGRQEQVQAVYSVLEQLPSCIFHTLERLIFHLVKVAVLEEMNRMSPNALAIVFAPCILRSPDSCDPLMSMKDVSKTTMCVELLITEQMQKYKLKMDEITQLETAEQLAIRRLSFLRLWPLEVGFSAPYDGVLSKGPRTPKPTEENPPSLVSLEEEPSDTDMEHEEEILIEQIQSIKEERDQLTLELPQLEQRGSDEENMDSEASWSMESLLDDRPAQVESGGSAVFQFTGCHKPLPATPEGTVTPTKPVLPTRPPIAQRRAFSMLTSIKLPRRKAVLPMRNIKLPPGIVSAVGGVPTSPGTTDGEPHPLAVTMRRRNLPSQRSDNIHSMYVQDFLPLPNTGETNPIPAKVQRRFSDPLADLPHGGDESAL
ncbi:unconventional myosin-IXb-like isoform X5 [Hemitrygon akajei]|uniref:unconventional myosin-IXb-like isoform X5 n=1 Tax=Hemitrygon akajei TaxID=2704970 RepID=UPI003BF9C9DB